MEVSDVVTKVVPWIAGLPISLKIIFSLIVILIAVFIVVLIWHPSIIKTTHKQNQSNPDTDNIINESGKLTKLTFKEIMDEIKKVAPFQMDDIEKHYVGLNVNWKGTLFYIAKTKSYSEPDKELVSIGMSPEKDELGHYIDFTVPIDEYPQFRIAKKGDMISVAGEIIKCKGRGGSIKLNVNEIIFYA